MPKIRKLLASLGLRLNEKKFYFQHYSKGVEFTGSIVKPGRVYTCNRAITNFIAAVRRLNKANNERQVLHAVCSINSYLGLLRHTNEYATRRKVLNMIEPHVFKELEMATTDKAPITLSSDRLDMDLFRLLLTRYVVVTEQRDGKVIYELNSIEHYADN